MDIEKHYDQIEAYLSNSLSTEAKTGFELQMKGDIPLKKAVLNHVLANEALGLTIEDKVAAKLKKLEQQRKKMPDNSRLKIGWRRSFSIAAGIFFFLFGGMLFWSNQNYSNSAIANNLYEESTLPTVRNEEVSSQNLTKGLLAFSNKKYAESIGFLSTIPRTDTYYLQAQYLLAHANWKATDFAKANKHFSQLLAASNLPPTIDRQEVEWNLLLINLWESDTESPIFKDNLATILSNPQHAYYQKAQILSQKLNSFWRNFTW